MKKIMFGFFFLLIISLSVFVYADASDSYQLDARGMDGTVTLEKGWNLITNFAVIRVFQEDLKTQYIRAIFMYDRYKGEYIRLYPDKELNKLNAFIRNVDVDNGAVITEYGAFNNGALWIYSDVKQTLNFHTIDGPLFVRYVGLKSGWNFLAITPEMTGKHLQDIKGTCNITKVAAWLPNTQEWDSKSDFLNLYFNDRSLEWKGIIVKVSSNCKLGDSGDAIVPPSLPGTGNNVPPVDPNPTPTSDFPQTINTYSLADSRHEDKECASNGAAVCVEGNKAEYRDSSSNKVIFVNLWDITSGTEGQFKELYANSNGSILETITIGSNKLYRLENLENHELFWFTGKDYPAIVLTQEGTITYSADGTSYSYGMATGNNEVTKKFLSLYPAQEVD